ncbi:hypothetical protein LWM68_32665 [Niabella sp. W65]|nr:hypothetical protein [Niabella sp. W65]MCH7367094.1 hypothetical protein [Niabella sp. W65]
MAGSAFYELKRGFINISLPAVLNCSGFLVSLSGEKFQVAAKAQKSSLIVGAAAITDALQQGKALDRIYVDTRLVSADLSVLRKLATELAVPINYVPQQKLNSFHVEDTAVVLRKFQKCNTRICRILFLLWWSRDKLLYS